MRSQEVDGHLSARVHFWGMMNGWCGGFMTMHAWDEMEWTRLKEEEPGGGGLQCTYLGMYYDPNSGFLFFPDYKQRSACVVRIASN